MIENYFDLMLEYYDMSVREWVDLDSIKQHVC